MTRHGEVAFALTKAETDSTRCRQSLNFICFQQLTLTGGLLFVVAPASALRRPAWSRV